MHKLTIATFLVALALAVPGRVSAAKYGMAGCGLGSIVMGAEGGQLSAATTNATFYSQFFGITSGTSNCSDADAGTTDQVAFMRNNFTNVALDAAVGDGQYLAALATLLGCEEEARPALFSVSQSEHSNIFIAGEQPQETLRRMKSAAQQDAVLRSSCARL